MSCRGGSQLLQPYFSGLLRHGHVSITVPAFAFFFLLAASRRESVGYLVAAAVTLFEQVFLRFDPSHYLRHVLGLHVLSPWNFPSGHWFFLSLKHSGVDRRTSPFQVKPKSSIDFVTVLSSIPSFRFTCLSVILLVGSFCGSWSSGKVIEDHALRFWFGLSVLLIYGISCYGHPRKPCLSPSLLQLA